LHHRIILVDWVEIARKPFPNLNSLTNILDQTVKFIKKKFTNFHIFRFQSQLFKCVNLKLNLPSTIQAARRTGHQLNVVKVTLVGFEFSYDVLYMLKAISRNKSQICARACHFLVMLVFSLFVEKWSVIVNFYTVDFTCRSSKNVLQIAIRSPAVFCSDHQDFRVKGLRHQPR